MFKKIKRQAKQEAMVLTLAYILGLYCKSSEFHKLDTYSMQIKNDIWDMAVAWQIEFMLLDYCQKYNPKLISLRMIKTT